MFGLFNKPHNKIKKVVRHPKIGEKWCLNPTTNPWGGTTYEHFPAKILGLKGGWVKYDMVYEGGSRFSECCEKVEEFIKWYHVVE